MVKIENVLARIVGDIQIPPMASVKQSFAAECLTVKEIPALLQGQLQAKLQGRLRPGMRVAVTAGSRGIANMPLITKHLVAYLKAQGVEPFLVPAMGSHGGATADGQRRVLEAYGFTEEYLNCPICSSMEVCQIASVEGHPVYIDKIAAEADGIIVCARIKPHTAFSGPVESGVQKMLVIGLGNDVGATYCHNQGYKHFARYIPLFAQTVLAHAPVLGAVATVENAYDQTQLLEVLAAGEIPTREPQLLAVAKKQMARLYIEDYDVLVVDRIGKDISGAGMDPHITGSFATPYASGPKRPQNIAVLDVTAASNGNIIGIGQADATTERLMQKAVLAEGYPNGIVSNMLSTCKIPVILANDQLAIRVCIKCCEDIDRARPRVIRIADTLHLGEIMVSQALLAEVEQSSNLEICSAPAKMWFDAEGNLF